MRQELECALKLLSNDSVVIDLAIDGQGKRVVVANNGLGSGVFDNRGGWFSIQEEM